MTGLSFTEMGVEDLATRRATLEREIAGLRRDLDAAQRRAQAGRERGPSPRGLYAGMLVGLAVVVAGFVTFAFWVAATIARGPGGWR